MACRYSEMGKSAGFICIHPGEPKNGAARTCKVAGFGFDNKERKKVCPYHKEITSPDAGNIYSSGLAQGLLHWGKGARVGADGYYYGTDPTNHNYDD